MVRDDEASRTAWLDPQEGALGAMSRGALAIECSTLSPSWVTALSVQAREAGVSFVEAPVVGSRPQAEGGSLVFLAGGEGAAVDRARPFLTPLGSAVHHLGDTPAGACATLIVMIARRFDPLFPVDLASKDLRYVMAAAAAVGSALPVVRGASEVFETGAASGLAQENLTAVAKLYA
jgi:3-hydroxyisobutyrate dehydrogenase-like beta-hydroxyacid dehydrogenase